MESKSKKNMRTRRSLPLEKSIEISDELNSKLGNVLCKTEDMSNLALIAQNPEANYNFIELLSNTAKPIGQALCGVAPFDIPTSMLESAKYLYTAAGHRDTLQPFINVDFADDKDKNE